MAYLGTPIDTQNQFQSLQGKRFSGDGSTTAFTLDIAPSSVFDIEVFVENVRQDPNSAYTLSGTTLTFTGAPPSGTNNIYVVHQAKAVGTIDVPNDSVTANSIRTPATIGGSPSTDANASSSISATGLARFVSASIGGFEVSTDQIISSNDNLILKDSGQITASNAQLTGKVTATSVPF